eukprot:NODE_13601_length_431_cov_27.595395_g13578_i0.p1 GENE.NODE_13601_length_431_cov_27.595395_g13578_i0~~NODE_13601_length_431_cov_27.595395_g13578_i0.p1  ORF type:complete len:125 (-),score=1.52 NODE_13601_length_431_cov_27.595395_g13578_i0:3-377(-)
MPSGRTSTANALTVPATGLAALSRRALPSYCCALRFFFFWITSLFRFGGIDASILVAFFVSGTTNVYRYVAQRTLNFVLFGFFFILTLLQSLRLQMNKNCLMSRISRGMVGIGQVLRTLPCTLR